MATKEKNYTNDYCKLSAEEYDNLASNAKGIIFGYRNSKGEISGSMHFFGTRFQATRKSQDEILRTLKAVIKIHWDISGKEADLRERNDAIRARRKYGSGNRYRRNQSGGIVPDNRQNNNKNHCPKSVPL